MSLGEAIVVGALNADGTLELDQMPNLSPGRVEVTIKPTSSAPSSRPGLAEVILQIQRDQAARGFIGLSTQEMADEEKARHEDDDDREVAAVTLGQNDEWSIPSESLGTRN